MLYFLKLPFYFSEHPTLNSIFYLVFYRTTCIIISINLLQEDKRKRQAGVELCQIASWEDCKWCLDTFPVGCGGGGCEEQ